MLPVRHFGDEKGSVYQGSMPVDAVHPIPFRKNKFHLLPVDSRLNTMVSVL